MSFYIKINGKLKLAEFYENRIILFTESASKHRKKSYSLSIEDIEDGFYRTIYVGIQSKTLSTVEFSLFSGDIHKKNVSNNSLLLYSDNFSDIEEYGFEMIDKGVATKIISFDLVKHLRVITESIKFNSMIETIISNKEINDWLQCNVLDVE